MDKQELNRAYERWFEQEFKPKSGGYWTGDMVPRAVFDAFYEDAMRWRDIRDIANKRADLQDRYPRQVMKPLGLSCTDPNAVVEYETVHRWVLQIHWYSAEADTLAKQVDEQLKRKNTR